jgi:hypothetical protein
VIGGAAALALGTAIAAPMAAHADYPPDQGIGVSVSPGQKPNQVDVVVTNVPAHCQVKVSSRGHDEYAYGGHGLVNGTATISDFTVGWKAGLYVVHIQTYGGGCKKKQSTTYKVVITKNKLFGPTSVRAGDSFTVNATGWLPGVPVTFTISNGSTTRSFSVKTNSKGDASRTLSVRTPGAWAVVATQDGGPTKSYALQVLPRHKLDRHHKESAHTGHH